MSEANGEGRKVICLGCPSYGELTLGAARGLYRASRRPEHDLRLMNQASSLLASNMNALWAWALNVARKGRCDYFAMIHADVEPEEFWLDKLIDELEARSLDVLGVVCPIKDQRGVTSTALGRPDGDTWRVHGRLTMREAYRLPETFTSADVGRPLLLNTGLWACRFDEAWARKVRFTINDRIAWDPGREVYFAQVEPEDWYFSRLLHELGLAVGCTRKVELGHRGTVLFGNDRPWGTHHFDEEYLPASPLPGPGEEFPHDVAGWLTEEEGRELGRLAEGKAVLEVGSYCGRSTVCLARKARFVQAVDTFDGRGTALEGDTLALFRRGLARHGVAGKVAEARGLSADVLPLLPPVFDLAFIDGSHDRESVARDAALASACLRPGGLLAFHDYGGPRDPGVAEAVDALVASGATLERVVGTVAVVRPVPREAEVSCGV